MIDSLLTVANCSNPDFGDLVIAIASRCKDMKAKQSFQAIIKPYSETLLARFADRALKQHMTYGKMHMSNGTERLAYVLTLTRADGKVTRWALFVDDMDMITEITEEDPNLRSSSMIMH
jgi:hypothetical protein